jgi:hypothetical protein
MFHAKVMRFEGAILKNEVAVWGGWVTVMPPAAAVWGIMSWEVEEEEGAWLAIVEEGGREGGRKAAMGKENNRVDGELVVSHVTRRK